MPALTMVVLDMEMVALLKCVAAAIGTSTSIDCGAVSNSRTWSGILKNNLKN